MPDGKPSVVPIAPNQAACRSALAKPLSTLRRALGERHRQQVLDAEGEVLAERRHARADDRHLPHADLPPATDSGSNM